MIREPAMPETGAFTVLVVAGLGGSGVHEAVLYRGHDVAGVVAAASAGVVLFLLPTLLLPTLLLPTLLLAVRPFAGRARTP